MVEIKQCSIIDLFVREDFHSLVKEYLAESSVKELGEYNVTVDMYIPLHNSGKFFVWGAFIEDELIGFVNVISLAMPHHGKLISTIESIFVAKQHRNTGAGVKFMRIVDEHAKNIGAVGVVYNAPIHGSLVEYLENSDKFVETSRVFFKRIKYD